MAAGTTLLMAPQASAATASPQIGFEIAGNTDSALGGSSLTLLGENPNIGDNSYASDTLSSVMELGTNVGLGRLPGGSYQVAFQGMNNDLWVSGQNYPADHTVTDTRIPMAPGTSPSLAELPNGGFWILFQHAGDGDLWSYSSFGSGPNTTSPLAAGTSPATAALANGNVGGPVLAWHDAATNDLMVSGPHGPINTGMQMATGASPTVAGLSTGGYEIAFQSANGDLSLYGTVQSGDTGRAILRNSGTANGSVPSITAEPVTSESPAGSFEVAYNAPGNFLAVYGNYGGIITGGNFTFREQGNVSPGITGVIVPANIGGAGNQFPGYDIAFQNIPSCDPNCDQPATLANLVTSDRQLLFEEDFTSNLGLSTFSSQLSVVAF